MYVFPFSYIIYYSLPTYFYNCCRYVFLLNRVAENGSWDFNMLFGIDVQALYPSIKFEYLALALIDCFEKCTDWTLQVKSILLDIIIYTLENQQVLWNGKYYMLNKGISTGGKHCVPLANIFLTYILSDLLNTNPDFRIQFETNIKLWKRYIDDCGGVYLGLKGIVKSQMYRLRRLCSKDSDFMEGIVNYKKVVSIRDI